MRQIKSEKAFVMSATGLVKSEIEFVNSVMIQVDLAMRQITFEMA